MAENSDGYSEVTTVVTCEGNLSDPGFPKQLERVVGSLNGILGEEVKVHKLEPWNSVRVTLSIPREAALRLRQLANEGSQQLRALGILSVHVEGDQTISLRLATGNSAPQEIVLRTSQDASSNDRTESADLGLSRFLSATSSASVASTSASSGPSMQVQFKSPNVVCPADSVVPKVGTSPGAPSASATVTGKAFAGPFPFASMNQAIHSNREPPYQNNLPPPYPGKHPPVTISSPLLVNLLQNDGTTKEQTVTSGSKVRTTSSLHKTSTITSGVSASAAPQLVKQNSSGSLMASPVVTPVNSSVLTPTSALSTLNSSIRQTSSTILTSTTASAAATAKIRTPPPPPPQYHRPSNPSIPVQQKPLASQPTAINGPITSSLGTISNSNNHIVQTVATASTSTLIQQPGTSLNQHGNHFNKSTMIMNKNNPNMPSNMSNMPSNMSNMPSNMPNMPSNMPNMPSNMPNMFKSNVANMAKLNQHKMMMHHPGIPLNNQSINMALQPPIGQPSVVMPTQSTTNPSMLSHGINNVLTRNMPSPPPYSVAISRPTWDFNDLTPTLTDLKADDLDELLPSLDPDNLLNDLPDLALQNVTESSTNDAPPIDDGRKFLINPLTGELEPQSSGESDTEETKDVFTGLPSPAAVSDDDTSSTIRPDTTTDQSDSETRSGETSKHSRKNSKIRERGRDSPALKPTEKIKLRLKLEKSEPINPAYKVDVSFINTQQPKKASSSVIGSGEELRVPPLHISLRGRNSVIIKNKNKLNPDGTPKAKVKRNPEYSKIKKSGSSEGGLNSEGVINPPVVGDGAIDSKSGNKVAGFETKKIKKFKSNHEHKDIISTLINQELDLKTKLHNHYKEKQKDRRGSDSDLVKSGFSKKYSESNGVISAEEKKRRMSHGMVHSSEHLESGEKPAVLGSTNVGTIMGLPQKPRKEKEKLNKKDSFKSKDASRNKLFAKNINSVKHVALPTSGEIDMEAKFKQGLLEGEKGVPRPPHRTEVVHHLITENNKIETAKVVKSLKEKSPDPDKCNTPDRKSTDLEAKSAGPGGGNRSPPNSGSSGGQGEDSGIESMDALSEKSPNQASQSPHADLVPPKTQVPDMLDIEAQLAKMEGLNGDNDRVVGKPGGEDVNENKHQSTKLAQCCELTCVLQDTLKGGDAKDAEKGKKEEELEPLPVRVTPPLYTYSNPEKSRGGSESPSISDEDSNSCSTSSSTLQSKNKSLLEQLLIEIPEHNTVPSSPSPATRSSVRTRALSKMNSPELLNSPVTKQPRTVTTKRKRNESDSSNQSLEESRNKKRKSTENSVEKPKNVGEKMNNVKGKSKIPGEDSDSDEPLMDKLRKNTPTVGSNSSNASNAPAKSNNVAAKAAKVKSSGDNIANNNKPAATVAPTVVSTRRSVRMNMPAQNTRSKGDTKVQQEADALKRKEKVQVQADSEALRRKTRSAVSEVDSKRKKEVK